MTIFRLVLIAIITFVGAYTVAVVGQHGVDFVSPFFGDIAEMGWPGQFNMDFWSFLILGSIWLMWRHHFSSLGLLFGVGHLRRRRAVPVQLSTDRNRKGQAGCGRAVARQGKGCRAQRQLAEVERSPRVAI